MNFVVYTVILFIFNAAFLYFILGNAKRETLKWRQSHDALLVSFANREAELFANAERLAEIVRQLIADVDSAAALFKDESPPELLAERSALRHHEKIKCNLSTSAQTKNP